MLSYLVRLDCLQVFYVLFILFIICSGLFHSAEYALQIAAEHVQVLNAVKSKLPFLVTTSDDAKDTLKEEIRLR